MFTKVARPLQNNDSNPKGQKIISRMQSHLLEEVQPTLLPQPKLFLRLRENLSEKITI
jgi:hypothetical protein